MKFIWELLLVSQCQFYYLLLFMIIRIFTLIAFLLSNHLIFAQNDALRHQIGQICNSYKAEIGVAIMGLGNKDTLTFNNSKHLPMQSVYKFHLALAVLHQVDKGKLSLNQMLSIKKSEMDSTTWSPMYKKFPNQDFEISIADILRYTVSQSDNNGCDILFRLLGGTKKVHKFIRKTGIKEVAIQATEAEMHKDWRTQFTNWTTPLAAVQLLAKFKEGKILSEKNTDFLWQLLVETSTGANRIKGLLPEGTIVGHKTGTARYEGHAESVVNDIGIVNMQKNPRYYLENCFPPSKQRRKKMQKIINLQNYAIAVFVSNSLENDDTNARIIAEISKAVFDFYQQ